jgi:DNA gyrase subunit B
LPPLYKVKRGEDARYCWTEEDRMKATNAYAQDGKIDSVNVQRYKGLGEMNADELCTTTMDKETRTRSLKQVSIEFVAEADYYFSMLMGDEVAPRRDFIELHAKYARIDI